MTKRSDWSGQRELRSVVRTVRRRWRTRQALRGVLLTGASGLAALLLVSFAVDRWFTSPTLATVFAAALYGGVAVVALLTLIRPLFRRVTNRQVAQYLEEHEPGLRAEILTAVDVLEEEQDEESAELLGGLIRSAVLRAREVEGGRRVDRDPLKRLSWSTGGLLALLAFILLADPLGLRQAVPDLVRPWTAVQAAPTLAIQVLPGDTVVARGAELRVAARLQGFDAENVELAVRGSEEAQWDRWPMLVEDLESDEHEVVLFRVDEPVEYYAEAEGIRSGTYRVDVVDLPYVGRLELELHHPDYTGLEPELIESGGDLVALPGTRVVVRAEPTLPVPAGRIVFEEAGSTPLAPDDDGMLTGEFVVEESGFYHLELQDRDGAAHRGTPDHLIDVVEDLPPIVSLEEPQRDVRVTSVEEVYVETQATDDYGIETLELIYSVNGGEEETLSLMDGRESSLAEVSAGYTFFLELFDLQPGDLISYHVRALDNGPASEERETRTDLFFIEVRPFSQDFRQAEQGGGGGGGAGGGQADPMAGQFSDRQREIVTATFNVGRDWRQIAPEIVEEDIATIRQAQASLQEEVDAFLDELRRRLARAPEEMQQVAETLPLAIEAMGEALTELETGETEDALPAEQRALQHLLRAEAVFREIQLTQQQQGGGGGGASGAEMREDLADFFDLEMDRLRNQYEELQQGERQQQDQQLDQALERLRELARRQEQEEERLQRAAERAPQGASGAGGESQRRLAEETEELARELERLSREQSSPELAETARQLREAAESMRRSAATRDQDGIRQAGDAQAALEEARRLLERDRTNRLNRDASEAADRTQQALDRQRDIQEAVENLPSDGQGRAEAVPSILEQKDELTEELEQLQEDLNRMAEEAPDPQTEREFREAASAIRDDQLTERIDFSRNLVGSASPQARDFEQQITDLMEDLNQQVRSAADAAEGNTENSGAELAERTRQLVRAAESMEQRTREAQQGQQDGQQQGQQDGEQQGQQGGQQQGQQGGQQQGQQGGQQQGQQGGQQQGQQGGQQGQQGGQPGGAQAGGGNPDGYAGGPGGWGGYDDVTRQLQREAGERRAQAEELREQLRAAGAPVESLETLDEVIQRFNDLERAGIYNEPVALSDIQRELVESLRQLDFDVRRHFATADREGPTVAGSGEVPEAYREMVEEYFRSLARP